MSDKKQDQGFIQGVAWAIGVTHRYNLSAGQMLHESGLDYTNFEVAGVLNSDLDSIKDVMRLEGIPLPRRARADNGDPDTIVPAPAPHKKRPSLQPLTRKGK